MVKELSHYLTRGFTKGSEEEIALAKTEQAKAKILHPKYIVYDFETDTHTDIHIPNHVEVDVLQIDDGFTHKYENCLVESFGIPGYDCDTKFCDWLFNERNSNSTVIAHNGAGYDNKFILQYCLSKGIVPSAFIRQGSRITYMSFKRYGLRFIDSIHFFLDPLKKLSKTYGIDTLKGHFPHKFNRPENPNYIAKIPAEDEFGVKNMMPDDYEEIKYEDDGKTIKERKGFLPWYEQQQHITDWNFKNEMIRYCRADVELLSKTVLKFRKMFKDNLDTDPFRYTTLASLCMSIYLNKFIPEKKIVGNGAEKQDSIVCREWLNYLNDKNVRREVPITCVKDDTCDIHKNKVGEKKEEYYNLKRTAEGGTTLGRPFTVDGFDIRKRKVYLFQGCFWHGCRKCHPENTTKYNKTMEQVNILEHNGYDVIQMWECEWKKLKETLPNKAEVEENAKQQNINVRDALFGGRTEGFKSYHKCSPGQKIFYYDVVSLYPTVNALDYYAVGFNRYVNITAQDILDEKFFGVAKVDITPPKDLYIPVLPDNSDKKLLFHLNPMKNKTFSSIELKYALEKGYTIKIHSALEYSRYKGLMKDYVEFFLKMKIENNEHYTPEECEKINKSHNALGFSFEIKSENTKKNPGMKQLAKICLNSLWGKFGQRTTLDSYEYVNEWNRLLLNITNSKVKTNSWHIINDNCVELRYTEDIDYHVEAEYISEITSVFTTANARLRLISMLHWLDPSQIIYCDTDSVIFLYDENDPTHKYPSNDAKDKPANISFGNALGEWENEFKDGDWIDEIVVAGAKSYAYRTSKGKTVIKQKGITLDRVNSNIFTFENVRDMVLENDTLESAKRFQFVWNTNKQIETRYISRSAKQTTDTKRILLSNHFTMPFGYELK